MNELFNFLSIALLLKLVTSVLDLITVSRRGRPSVPARKALQLTGRGPVPASRGSEPNRREMDRKREKKEN